MFAIKEQRAVTLHRWKGTGWTYMEAASILTNTLGKCSALLTNVYAGLMIKLLWGKFWIFLSWGIFLDLCDKHRHELASSMCYLVEVNWKVYFGPFVWRLHRLDLIYFISLYRHVYIKICIFLVVHRLLLYISHEAKRNMLFPWAALKC